MIPNAMVTVVEKDGRRFVAEELLINWGYDPKEFDVVLIRGTYYELCGKVGDQTITGWWIEPIDVEAEVTRLREALP